MTDATTRVALYIKATTTAKADVRTEESRAAAGCTPGWSVVAVYTDLGAARRRPALQQAFAAAEAGEFGLLLVDSVTDLTGAPQLSGIVDRFQAGSVQVRSVAEQFDSSNRFASLILTYLDVIAERRLDRVRRGRQHAARLLPASAAPAQPRTRSAAGPAVVVTVQALYDAVGDDRLPWLDALLIRAGAMRRCACTAMAPADAPCPFCGNPRTADLAAREPGTTEGTVTAMTQTTPTIRVAVYLRAASMPLAADQAALLHRVAGIMAGWRIVAVFCDVSTGPARPARDGVIAAAQSGGFDVLLMTELNRLTRNLGVAHDLISRLTAASVTVCILDWRPTAPTRYDGPALRVLTGDPAEQAVQRLRALTAGHPTAPVLAIGPAPADEER